MEAAWVQLEEFQKVNQQLNQIQLGNVIATCLHKRMGYFQDDQLLRITDPLAPKIAIGEAQSLRTNLGNSAIPNVLYRRNGSKLFGKGRRKNKRYQAVKEEDLIRLASTEFVADQLRFHGIIPRDIPNTLTPKSLPPIPAVKALAQTIHGTSLNPIVTIKGKIAAQLKGYRAYERTHTAGIRIPMNAMSLLP